VLNPVFNTKDIEVERHVILQEIGQALDTPDDIIFDWLHEVSYPDQPFGRTILGLEERVAQFSRADLKGFVNAHYGPDKMIVSAAGGVDHDQLVALATDIFGGLKSIGNGLIAPAAFSGGERREVKDLEQVHFALNFEAPGYRDADVYTAQVYATAMGGGMSSRLFQKIREERGLCYSIFAQSGAYEDTGQITVYAGTSADEITALTGLAVDEIKRAAEDMTEAEVARARAQLKAGLVMGLESPSNRAERNARLLSIWGRVPEVSEAVQKIDDVSVGDVRRYAEALTSVQTAVALYGPVAKAPGLEEIRQGLAA
jgi:predicted Zn-dependent peptidase